MVQRGGDVVVESERQSLNREGDVEDDPEKDPEKDPDWASEVSRCTPSY